MSRALLWAALLVLLPGSLAAQNRGERLELVEVAFEGNEAFLDDSLAVALVNRETECKNFIFEYLQLCRLGLDFADDRRYLQPRQISLDSLRLKVYYAQRGYREATIDTSLVRDSVENEVTLTFGIVEGRPVVVDTIMFTGDDVPDPDRVFRRLPLRPGDPLSVIERDALQDTIQNRLRNSGYARAEVFSNTFIPADSYEAEVEFDIYTGPFSRFGEIDVRWNDPDHSLSEESVLRFLPFSTGDPYEQDEILLAQRSLFGVALIQSARIAEDTLVQAPDSVVPLVVTISEGDVHRVGAGAGWSTADCFNADARWTHRNFLGSARRLGIRGRVSNVFAENLKGSACRDAGSGEFARLNWLTSVDFTQPWVFSTRNSLSLSLYGERASLKDAYVREAIGASIAVSRLLAPQLPATVSFRPELSRLTAAEDLFCTSFLVCEPSDIEVLQGANWLSPLGLSVSFDRTDDLINPSNGYQVSGDLEYASSLTGSNYRYTRAVAEASWYDELARRTVIAARVRTGWVGRGEFIDAQIQEAVQVVHPQKRFYAGGASSVRGFAQNRLGPRILSANVADLLSEVDDQPVCTPQEIVDLSCDGNALDDDTFFPRPTGGSRLLEGNIEYRLNLGGPLQGVAFVDAGQVWRDDQKLSLSDMEFTPGVGVRYFSPVGPIRIDVGYRFRSLDALDVVTAQIRPFDDALDDDDDRICIDVGNRNGDCEPIPWVRLDRIALLRTPIDFGPGDGFSLRKFQLHFSIGQAF